MELMIIAMMNSWFALLFICLRPFILINGTHMCSDVPTLRRPWPALIGNMRGSDVETWGIYFTTDQHGERRVMRQRWREEERGGEQAAAGERKRKREREGGGWDGGWSGGYTIL